MHDHSLIISVGSKLFAALIAAAFIAAGLPRLADAASAEIISVHAEKLMPRVFRFDVTIQHEGESPEHYVDRWEILDEQGEIIDVRTLTHAHVNEQPFTRSLSHVTIPVGSRSVTIRAHDTIHGYGARVQTVHLEIESRYDSID